MAEAITPADPRLAIIEALYPISAYELRPHASHAGGFRFRAHAVVSVWIVRVLA